MVTTKRTKTLDSLRRAIDSLDRTLVRLLNRRATAAVRIGNAKKRQGLRIFDPMRERQILARVKRLNRGPLSHKALAGVFSEIMSVCRMLQRK